MNSASRPLSRRLLLPGSALIALSAFMHACGGGGGGGGGGTPPPPNPNPGVSTFVPTLRSPTNSATGVSRIPVILIGFNDDVNTATMNAGTVQLLNGSTPVATTLNYIPCARQIQMTPTPVLDVTTSYTVNLTSGLLDDDGEGLVASTFNFTTNGSTDVDAPTFNAVGFTGMGNPGNETTEILLTWNDGSDPGNAPGTISYRVYFTPQASPCFDFSSPVAATGPGILQAVVPGLTPRTTYSFIVRAVDAAGNESQNAVSLDVTTFTSFLQNVMPVVSNFCVSCHNPPNGQAWQNTPQITMDYSTPGTVYATWVGIAPSWPAAANAGMLRVDPGNAANSFLWNKISSPTPVAGSMMPFGQPALSAANQDIVFDWIEQGAMDN